MGRTIDPHGKHACRHEGAVWLRASIETPIRGSPRITLEEVDADEVVVRISATPLDPRDGPRLAGEVLRAITPQVASGDSRSG